MSLTLPLHLFVVTSRGVGTAEVATRGVLVVTQEELVRIYQRFEPVAAAKHSSLAPGCRAKAYSLSRVHGTIL